MASILGTCYYSREDGTPLGSQWKYTKHIFQWTCDASGDVKYYMEIPEIIVGIPWRLTTRPIDGPTVDYDITLLNVEGADVLLGKGLNRHNTNIEIAFIYEGTNTDVRNATEGRHTFVVTNAGVSTSGVAALWVVDASLARPVMPLGEV